MFGTILIIAVTLMQAYVFWRGSSSALVKRYVPRPLFFGLGALLWLGFVFGRSWARHGTGVFAGSAELLVMNWLGTIFLFFVPLLAVDVVTAFGLILPRFSSLLRTYALLAGAALSVFAVIQGVRPPVVREYEVKLAGLPKTMDGTVIAALADTHLGSLLGTEWLEARVAQVHALKPDMIVLLGDIGEGHGGKQAEFLPVLQKLSAPLGVWAVLGNHDSNRRGRTSLLTESGLPILCNEWKEIKPGLVLAGVEDLTSRRRYGRNNDPVPEALSGRPHGATILLSHTPWETEKAAAAGAGLMLCGHTHGGQIWPFSYLVQNHYPLLAGRYDVNGMTVIVSRGTGTWGPRMRLWHPGEILRITLRSHD